MLDGTGAKGKCLFLQNIADKGYLPTVIKGCIVLSGSFIRLALHVHFRIEVRHVMTFSMNVWIVHSKSKIRRNNDRVFLLCIHHALFGI